MFWFSLSTVSIDERMRRANMCCLVIRSMTIKTSFQDRVAAHLFRQGINEEREIHLYFISLVAIIISLLGYTYSLAVFIIYSSPVVFWINFASILFTLVLLLFHRKKQYTIVAIGLTVHMTLYAALNSVLSGLATHLSGYYAVALVFQLIMPYPSKHLRPYVLAFCLLLSAISTIICLCIPPILHMSQFLIDFSAVSNIYMMLVCVLIQLHLVNISNTIVERLRELRLEQLSMLANTDALTGLYNRRYADEFFAAHRPTGPSTHCIAILDIDDFKFVNDTYGHDCGDEILRFLADFLRSHLRKVDYVFRWGGEEFLVVIEGNDLQVASKVLDKLREELQYAPIPTRAGELSITVTIGVSLLTSDIEESIHDSDTKLYRGKRSGKNVVVA